MNDFIQKLLDDIHNIDPELALKRQTEYNQNFVNKALNEQCDIHVVSSSNDIIGVNLEFVGETYEIMEGVMFEKGTKSWLPTDEWEKIKNEMTEWVVI